jgi:fused signal recognition particle receptor
MLNRFFGRQDEAKIEAGLTKTRQGLVGRLAAVLGPGDITDETWDDLEAQLVMSDVGATTAGDLIAALRSEARRASVRRADEIPALLQAVMVRALSDAVGTRDMVALDGATMPQPFVILVVGVNGSGKTTTIAKLACWFAHQGQTPLIVAADTYRAAAAEQLTTWGDRLGVPVVTGQSGGDPGAVVFDALESRAGQSAQVVIVDTAGRLHTQRNLMAELEKVRRVIDRVVPGAPHETLLVLDATTGQNGLPQARAFAAAAGVTGLVLAKLDSSAKGGVAFAVVRELGVPIRFVGTGEGAEDLAPFDPASYVSSLVGRAVSSESVPS